MEFNESVEAVAGIIGRYVHKHGPSKIYQVRIGVGPRYRPGLVEGAAYAIRQGWIALDEADVMRPGEITPPTAGRLGDLAAQIRSAAAGAPKDGS